MFNFICLIVEWSVKGNSIAVARKNTLSLLSSKFKERLCMSLSFKSWIGDSGVNCTVKGILFIMHLILCLL